jgi:hypothetical protein
VFNRIILGGVEKIDSGLERLVEDPERRCLVGLIAERHRAHADLRHHNRALA